MRPCLWTPTVETERSIRKSFRTRSRNMKCLSVGLCLLVVAETAVLSGMNHFTDGHEVEENLVLSRRKEFTEHDHRTDSAYAGILGKTDIVPQET